MIGNKEDQRKSALNIIFLGNSITAGYGLAHPLDAFPNLIAERMEESDIPVKVINAGISGETTAGALERLPLILSFPLDIMVIELGINDFLMELDRDTVATNLKSIIQKTKNAFPNATILLTDIKLSTLEPGSTTEDFQKLFTELANEEQIELLPSYLEYIWTNSDLVLPDRLHPNKKGYELIAERVWKSLSRYI